MSRGTIIFDFDGTIANSFDVVLELFYELTGHERLGNEEVTELRRSPIRTVIKRVGIPLRQIPMLLVKGRAMMRRRMHDIDVFPGINSALEALHDDGWQLMVMSSNSRQNVDAYLKTHKLRENFDKVYGNVGVFSKTQGLRKILRQNKLDRRECFYVGDEVRDMQAARKARVRGVAVAWGFNDRSILETEKPFAIAQTPASLAKIFSEQPLE